MTCSAELYINILQVPIYTSEKKWIRIHHQASDPRYTGYLFNTNC